MIYLLQIKFISIKFYNIKNNHTRLLLLLKNFFRLDCVECFLCVCVLKPKYWFFTVFIWKFLLFIFCRKLSIFGDIDSYKYGN